MTIGYTLLAVAITSLISVLAVLALSASQSTLRKISFLLVSLAAGTLIGDVFIHLLPEASEISSVNIWPLVIVGIAAFFILEKIIHWRHCHHETTPDHPHPVGTMNLLGDTLHNFLDGVLIAGSFIVDINLGIATTIAVILHEIPQEIGDFGVLIHAGYSKIKALLFNFLSSLSAFAGAIVVLALGQKAASFGEILVPITAGGFIYIAVSDLLPEMRKENRVAWSVGQLALLGVGVGIMYALKLFS